MNKNICFLILSTFLLLGEIQAQVHVKSYGASIRIPENNEIRCPGNLSFEEGERKTSDLLLEGSIFLQGNLSNQGQTTTQAHSSHATGRLVFNSATHRQYIQGNNTLTVPQLILNNPQGLGLEQNLEISHHLAFEQGKIYTHRSRLSILAADTTAISNFGPERYVVGTLRRYLSIGINRFPVGSENSLQFMQMEIGQLSGPSYVDVSFSELPGRLNESVQVDGGRITELLDNGVWQLTSHMAPIGSFDLTLQSTAHTNGGTLEGMHTFLVDKGMGWEALGQTNGSIGSEANIQVTRTGISSYGDFAIGKSTYVLANPDLLPLADFHISNNGSSQKSVGITFTARSPGAYALELRDIRGRKLNSWNSFANIGRNEKAIDLSQFPEGIYLLTLIKDGLQLEQKIW